MSKVQPLGGPLASLNPNKTFPIDLTSPSSVKGLILLGSLVVFIVGCTALALAIYCFCGRKAPLIFLNGAENKNLIVSMESGEATINNDQKKIKNFDQILRPLVTKLVKRQRLNAAE
ncbi:hypothetical protein BIW11_03923 [Tropilaelaps mercedesae]|uniref:Uncharacterized protein n=1 Tax=Tropilaelaps mercedesae TaxID=418985 RepID=A0A1V9XE84_9ACAR|nr:hypothetical protein BIW11_03923 [Tropilaelaps mercedesae]